MRFGPANGGKRSERHGSKSIWNPGTVMSMAACHTVFDTVMIPVPSNTTPVPLNKDLERIHDSNLKRFKIIARVSIDVTFVCHTRNDLEPSSKEYLVEDGTHK